MLSPRFWRLAPPSLTATLLSPLAAVTTWMTASRVARPGWRAPVPVICCGNVTVGGAGKTILAIDLGQRLRDRRLAIHFLTRGHGGRVRGVLRVAQEHAASLVGDEPKLLAEVAPTWVGADRAAAARAAIAAGAQALVMDDGLQNPRLAKDLSFLVVDGGVGFGNGMPLPAGPLREPVAAGVARCNAAVLIGADATGARKSLGELPILRAWLSPGNLTRALAGKRVVAFAGIGRPGKFFATLEEAGAVLVGRHGFADHHLFTEPEIDFLLAEADRLAATPVTTAKDSVRLPLARRAEVEVGDVVLKWQNPELIEGLLRSLFRAAADPVVLPNELGPRHR